MVQDKADRFLFKWYHGPIISYMLALTFESLGWKTTFAESEFLKWRSLDLDVRKPHDFRPDYESKDTESFFACWPCGLGSDQANLLHLNEILLKYPLNLGLYRRFWG